MWGEARDVRGSGTRVVRGRQPTTDESAVGRSGAWRRLRAGLAFVAFLLALAVAGGTAAQPATPPGRTPRGAAPPDVTSPPAVIVNRATGRVYKADPSRKVLAVRASDSAPPRRPDERQGRPARAARPDLGTVPVGDGPYAVAADPGRNRIYVANGGSGTVSVVDGALDRVLATVPVGRTPAAIAVDRSTGRVLVANRDGNSVSVLDDGGRHVAATIPVGEAPVALLVQDGRAYVAHRGTRDIAEIAPDGKSAKMLPGGFAARAAAIRPAAAGTTFAVTPSSDDKVDVTPGDGQCRTVSGSCSLRAAIQEANALPGADTITLPAGTYALMIAGASEDLGATGDLDIRDDLTIAGAGANSTAIDARGLDRVLHVVTPSVVEIRGVTLRGGRTPWDWDDNPPPRGGGIYNPVGALTLRDSLVTANGIEDEGYGGGIMTTAALVLASSTVSGNGSYQLGSYQLEGGGIYNWGGSVTLDRATISGNWSDSYTVSAGIDNDGGGTVSGADVTISGNRDGSGILNHRGATVTLQRAEITGNDTWPGGGGGLSNYGVATLRQVAVRGNRALEEDCGSSGGGISNHGTLTVTDSVISENRSDYGGGVYGGGTFTNVTISHNGASGCGYGAGQGGGAYVWGIAAFTNVVIGDNTANGTTEEGGDPARGGGLYVSLVSGTTFADLTFTNVSISGNRAATLGEGGGVYGGGTFTNATIVDNAADGAYIGYGSERVWSPGRGGGLFGAAGAFDLRGTLLADNAVEATEETLAGANCDGTPTSRGNNLDSDGTCEFAAAGDLSNTPARLGPLADNGGPTRTHALLAGSPALDTGPVTGCPATDQRGKARPQDGNADGVPVCDIGAYEATPMPPPAPPVAGNLVRNPSFEADLGAWSSSEAALQRVSGGKDGAWAMRVAQAGASASVDVGDNPATVANPPRGEAFTATAWVRAAGPARKPVRLVLLERGGPSGPVETAGAVLTPTDAWQQVTVSHLVAQPGRTTLELSVRQPTAAPGDTFLLDAVTLARGATPLLTVTTVGHGKGTVSSSPGGITCGTDCSESYPPGAPVQLTATAVAGSTFDGWGGACTGAQPTCTVVMDGAKAVQAHFKPTADLALTISDSPDPVVVGATLTYTIRVTNNGPNPAAAVTVGDTLTDLVFESASASQGTCTASATTPVKVTCSLGSLAAGGSATVTLLARPTVPTEALRNTAYATVVPAADPTPAKATATTRVVAGAAMRSN